MEHRLQEQEAVEVEQDVILEIHLLLEQVVVELEVQEMVLHPQVQCVEQLIQVVELVEQVDQIQMAVQVDQA
jgi:hypothetical protein